MNVASFPLFRKHRTGLSRMLLALIIFVVVFLRLKAFLHGNSLMIDEANVAMNIAERNFWGLWQPLDYEQYAPPLFLTGVKLSTFIFGMNEYALRAPALISSFMSVYLIFRLCRQSRIQLPYLYIGIVLILFGSSHIMIFQSDLLKQYTTDAMLSLLFILVTLKYHYSFILTRKGILFWTLLGSAAIWTSMPSVFVLGSIGMYYLYQSAQDKKASALLPYLSIPVLIWIAQFLFYFFTILKSDAESDYLQSYHEQYFFDYALWQKESWIQNSKIISGLIQVFIGKTVIVFIWVGITAVAGMISMAKNKAGVLILLIFPGICAVVASFLHYYSFIPRLLIFFAPLFFILMAIGLRALWNSAGTPGRTLLLLSTLFVGAQMSGWKYMLPENHCLIAETREVLDEIALPADSSFAVFVNHSGAPTLRFYTLYHDQKIKYQPFVGFRHINWDEDIVAESRSFLNRNPERHLLVLWGNEQNKVIQKQVNDLKSGDVVVNQDIEKTMARGIEVVSK